MKKEVKMADKVERILSVFDFDLVYQFMKMSDWTWQGFGIPCVKKLEETAKHLLQEAAQKNGYTDIGTGGFRVIKEDDGLELSFCITVSSSAD